jgi:uncharacterized protein DUF4019
MECTLSPGATFTFQDNDAVGSFTHWLTRRIRMMQRAPQLSFGKRARQALVLSLVLAGVGVASAQQAPAGLDKAMTTAAKWVGQADANQADAMWKASSPTMQKNVSQADWNKYVASLRSQLGTSQGRSWVGVSKVDNPQGMPAGEYLNVIYAGKYAKGMTVETVSMARDSSNWQPVGYIVRQQQPQSNSAAPNNAAKPAADAGKK